MKINIRLVFGIFVLLMLSFNLAVLSFHAIPSENQNSFTQLSGTIQSLAGFVVGYYFATTEGSKRKTDMLAEQLTHTNEKLDEAKGTPDSPVNVVLKNKDGVNDENVQ